MADSVVSAGDVCGDCGEYAAGYVRLAGGYGAP